MMNNAPPYLRKLAERLIAALHRRELFYAVAAVLPDPDEIRLKYGPCHPAISIINQSCFEDGRNYPSVILWTDGPHPYPGAIQYPIRRGQGPGAVAENMQYWIEFWRRVRDGRPLPRAKNGRGARFWLRWNRPRKLRC